MNWAIVLIICIAIVICVDCICDTIKSIMENRDKLFYENYYKNIEHDIEKEEEK